MKNKIILFLLIITISLKINAQVSFGPRIGYNMATMSYTSGGSGVETKMIHSFSIGGFADFKVTNNFYFETGVFLSGKGVFQDLNYNMILFTDTISMIGSIESRPLYIEIPINLLYKLELNDAKLHFYGGPYFSIGIGGKYKNAYIIHNSMTPTDNVTDFTEGDITYGMDASNMMLPLDFGVNIGVGIEYYKTFLKFQYGLGLVNQEPDESKNLSIKHRVLSISVGYIFGEDEGRSKKHRSKHRRRR